MRTPVRALMLDVDGVLVTGRPLDEHPWQSTLEADLGIAPDALHRVFFGPSWRRIVRGEEDMLPPLTRALAEIAPHCSVESFVDYWFRHDARLCEPLLSAIDFLRGAGIRTYLTTNQEHLRAAYLMNTVGLQRYVDGVFYSAQLRAAKPETQFFAAVRARVAMDATELLLIDDSLENVRAAVEAGWQALHWTDQSAPDILTALRALPAT